MTRAVSAAVAAEMQPSVHIYPLDSSVQHAHKRGYAFCIIDVLSPPSAGPLPVSSGCLEIGNQVPTGKPLY